jgi:hypothetical protein
MQHWRCIAKPEMMIQIRSGRNKFPIVKLQQRQHIRIKHFLQGFICQSNLPAKRPLFDPVGLLPFEPVFKGNAPCRSGPKKAKFLLGSKSRAVMNLMMLPWQKLQRKNRNGMSKTDSTGNRLFLRDTFIFLIPSLKVLLPEEIHDISLFGI